MEEHKRIFARWTVIFVMFLVVLGILSALAHLFGGWWVSGLTALTTAALLTATLALLLRKIAEENNQASGAAYRQLETALKLHQKFLAAHSEREILQTVLEALSETLQAEGASFVPFDEWGQSLPALIYGKAPETALKNWPARLLAPETRQECKSCQALHGKAGCALFPTQSADIARVRCFRLPAGEGHEVGVFNFFFGETESDSPEAERFVQQTLISAGQALKTLRSRDQEIAALLYLQAATAPKSDLTVLLNSLLENIHQALDVNFVLLYLPGGIPGKPGTAPQLFTFQKSQENTSSPIPDRAFLEGLWQSVLTNRQSISLENVTLNKSEMWKSLLAVPLVWQNLKPEGVLVLGSNAIHAFAQRHQALLETLAGQAALLIQNARLMAQVEYQAVLDERTRLAREIHDGLAQTLAFLKIQVAQMQNYLSAGELERLTHTLEVNYRTVSDAYIDARQAIDNLRRMPSSNLSEWVRQVAADYNQTTGQKVDLTHFNVSGSYQASMQAQLIRIIQESLSNVRKHAEAQRVAISGKENPDCVVIEIRDDGKGFTPEQVDANSRYGLRGMRERAESIGADFQIISQPSGGTTISLRIPTSIKEPQ